MPSRLNLRQIEEKTQAIGTQIYDLCRSEWRKEFASRDWTARLLNWSSRHDAMRLKMFRFVDTLPALTTDTHIVRQLKEYFSGDETQGLFRAGLSVAHLGSVGEKVVAHTLKQVIKHLAKTFIAATNPDEAVKTAQRLRQNRKTFTFDVLGEATLSHQEADRYGQKYLELLNRLIDASTRWPVVDQIDRFPGGDVPKVNLSIKLSALHPYFDPINPDKSIAEVSSRLLPIAQLAARGGAHLHIDAEQYAIKDLALATFRFMCEQSITSDYRGLGTVIQAYLKESSRDAMDMIAWANRRGTPVTIRLVKGAYWDYETAHAALMGWPTPVFTAKSETDARYESLTRLLLTKSDVIDLAIASHNIRQVAHALAVASYLGLHQGAIEFQFLYGMAEPLQKALVQMGERVRVYLPYGELIPGMAYLVRRLLENTSQHSFIRRGFAESETVEKLLRDPELDLNAKDHPEQTSKPSSDAVHIFDNEPHLDFSQSTSRQGIQQAIEQVRYRLGLRYPLRIGHEEIETEEWAPSVNPACPEEVIGYIAQAGIEHARQAITTAEQSFGVWAQMPQRRRSNILDKAAEIMKARRMELAAWIVLEAGKPWREADGDVAEAIDFLRYYAKSAQSLLSPVTLGNRPGEINVVQKSARGVTVVIAPWNFPLAILAGMTAAALVTGNPVVVKPAQPTPIIAYHFVQMLKEAGVPPEAIHFVPGSGKVIGRALVSDERVKTIAFTGSKEVGLEIIQRASTTHPGQRHVKRIIAEMGGKNAIIVDADADLDEAVAGVVTSAFGYAGQKCSACSRVIIADEVYGDFTSRLVAATESVPWGFAEDPETVVGPVISEDAKLKIEKYIGIGENEGSLLLKREMSEIQRRSKGYWVPPTIIAEVSADAIVAREEIFGPVLTCFRSTSFDEALQLAHQSDYALTGGLYSRSPAHITWAKQHFHVGNLYINRPITGAYVARQPFGGLGLSGVGYKSGGPEYLQQFIDTRTVTENTLRRGFVSEETT